MADNREFMHGVSLLPVGTKFLTIFASNNYPPTSPPGDWQHDVFYSWLDSKHPKLDVKTLITRGEAQEPASAAINSNGKILVTCEDGLSGIHQYAGMWGSDDALTNITPYPNIFVRSGGHSGNVVAVGDKFLVTYSEGWVDGGGVDNLGTGDDIWARFVNDDGTLGSEIQVSVGGTYRDWWPVTATSGTHSIVVFQRYTGATALPSLECAIVESTGTVSQRTMVHTSTDYYNYQVRWVAAIERYLVIGTNALGAYFILVDRNGTIGHKTVAVAKKSVREARFVVNGSKVYYPVEPNEIGYVDVGLSAITLTKTRSVGFNWDYIGADSIMLDSGRALFAANTTTALRLVIVCSDGCVNLLN